MSATSELAAFCSSLFFEALPARVIDRARLLTLDLVGNIIRGGAVESTAPLLSAVDALGLSGGQYRVLGDSRCYSAAGAALISATRAHSLDFDDTHAASAMHPGAPVIPAAFVAGEMVGATGATVLAGIVAGYEVAIRLSLALPAGEHYQRGFHPTATCGAFGAAAAAGRVLGLDAARMESAFGLALSQSAGSLQFLVDGAWTKRFQVGWASLSGLTAATLALHGYRGPAEALEGKHGFLRAHAPSPTPARATENLGEAFELMATAVKPYPSCRFGHAGIDAALALRALHRLEASEIESVTYGLSNAGMTLVGTPAEKKADPRNVVDAQFSAPFVLAAALATGRMQWDSYELLGDAGIRNLMSKVRCEHSPEIEAEFPANMSGLLTIRARGERFTRKIVAPRGEPTNFMSEEELRAKYLSLTGNVLGKDRSEALAAEVLRLDARSDIRRILQAAAPEPA